MIESQAFQNAMLKQARKMDAGGLPVVELLMKSLLFRGGSETANARLAVKQNEKLVLEKKQRDLQKKHSSVKAEIERVSFEEELLKGKAEDGGDIASQVKRLESGFNYDDWKARGGQA